MLWASYRHHIFDPPTNDLKGQSKNKLRTLDLTEHFLVNQIIIYHQIQSSNFCAVNQG